MPEMHTSTIVMSRLHTILMYSLYIPKESSCSKFKWKDYSPVKPLLVLVIVSYCSDFFKRYFFFRVYMSHRNSQMFTWFLNYPPHHEDFIRQVCDVFAMSLRWTTKSLFVGILNNDYEFWSPSHSLNSLLIIEKVADISVISCSVKVICILG